MEYFNSTGPPGAWISPYHPSDTHCSLPGTSQDTSYTHVAGLTSWPVATTVILYVPACMNLLTPATMCSTVIDGELLEADTKSTCLRPPGFSANSIWYWNPAIPGLLSCFK
jgi:hypothetical protein